jgi:hypothetical protein
MDLEKKAREEKVFNLAKNYDRDRRENHTRPRPFKLSTTNARMNKK